jgi:AraC-like DNA-binding protein
MANSMQLGNIGVGIRHNAAFTVNRPAGSGDIVVLHFLTEIRLLSRAGRTVERPGACIIYTPLHPQWYTAVKKGFNHDWFHVSGPGASRAIRKYGLPVNAVFYPDHPDSVSAAVSDLQREKWRGDAHATEAIALRLELFFLELSRAVLGIGRKGMTSYKGELQKIFKALRVKIHEEPDRAWTVPMMAGEVHLSVSRFSDLYREYFGISPIQELIKARLDRACWLLMSSTMSVADVARESGFENIYYFSRLFHRRLGCAPRDYGRKVVEESAAGSI